MDNQPTTQQAYVTTMAIAYEKDYEIEDEVLSEPFVILKPVGREGYAWWNGKKGKGKVERLIDALKTDLKVSEACVFAGISVDQYRYFCEVHKSVSLVKARCKAYVAILAKRGLAVDMKNPKESRARQWYLERKQPEIYGRNIGANITVPPNAAAKLTGEAFLDDEGKIIISRQTAEYLEQADGDDQDGTGSVA